MASDTVDARDLGIDVASGGEEEVFKWFLASFLFGKPIQQDIAADTYKVIVETHGRDTPQKICNCSWQELVDMLGEGNYTRYDESTASNLLGMCSKLIDEYDGRLGNMKEESTDASDFKKRLEEFKDVGPTTAEVFMREVEPVWF